MQSHIEKTLLSGHASYKVSLSVRLLQQIPLLYNSLLILFSYQVLSEFFFLTTLSAELSLNFLILQAGYLNIWEPATLVIKREGYSIKCSGPSGAVVSEKFSSATIVWFLIC